MKWGPEEKERLRSLLAKGLKPAEIAEIFGVARQNISSACSRFGFNTANAWTDEIVAFMREGLERGVIVANMAGAINAKFGTSFTRSAVFRKAQREGIIFTQSEASKLSAKKTRQNPTSKAIKARLLAASPTVMSSAPSAEEVCGSAGIGMMALSRFHCRAVIAERGEDGLAVFCGARVAHKAGIPSEFHSWCVHHALKYVVTPEKPRARESLRSQVFMEAAE